MKALTDNLARFAPPLWLTLAVAAVAGAALLVAFVETLQENVRHGEEMRQWQRVGVVRQAIGTVANAGPSAQAPESGTLNSPNFQR